MLKTPVSRSFRGKDATLAKDAADIALFGRMVANDHSLTLEGAAMFGHALSTHKVDNEIDFFAAVDDLQPREEAGAGMTGTLEFNSGTYYRFAALNLEMLFNPAAEEDEHKGHLRAMTQDQRRQVVRAFVEATLMAIPTARKNSMNAATLPGYVLGVLRKNEHPVQLVNAFEKPIRAFGGKGLFESSLEALLRERRRLNEIWHLDERKKDGSIQQRALWKGSILGMTLSEEGRKKPERYMNGNETGGEMALADYIKEIPIKSLDGFLDEIAQHVD